MNTFMARNSLPEGYAERETIDLVRNRRQMLTVNGTAAALVLGMVLIGLAIAPDGHEQILDIANHGIKTAFQCLSICIGIFAYLIAHEAVHGLLMWHYSHVKPSYGFSFTYAYAGSGCYFGKNAYLAIALAPAAIWSAVLLAAAFAVPCDWFWVVWAIQVMNISGAAGDFYVFIHILRQPKTILVQDTGTAMTVYELKK